MESAQKISRCMRQEVALEYQKLAPVFHSQVLRGWKGKEARKAELGDRLSYELG
jgi:hypothetical protein